jgi:hypothetical protein
MDDFWKTVLWQQFGAAIDMLENAMRACPNDLWSNTEEKPAWVKKSVVGFWYVVYHTLFWLDFCLSDSETPRRLSSGEVNGAELLLYNMRHVQHHVAQLNLLLRQTVDSAPAWVAKTRS